MPHPNARPIPELTIPNCSNLHNPHTHSLRALRVRTKLYTHTLCPSLPPHPRPPPLPHLLIDGKPVVVAERQQPHPIQQPLPQPLPRRRRDHVIQQRPPVPVLHPALAGAAALQAGDTGGRVGLCQKVCLWRDEGRYSGGSCGRPATQLPE